MSNDHSGNDGTSNKTVVTSALLAFATPTQKIYLQAVIDHNHNQTAAAEACGVKRATIQSAYRRVMRKARLHGVDSDHDMNVEVPEPFILKGTSSYYKYDKDGTPKLRGQWVKTKLDDQKYLELLQEVVSGIISETPRLAPLPCPKVNIADLMNVYTMTDCHMGMLAWEDETGQRWDLDTGERVLRGCFELMVKSSQAAKYCVVAQLGDFLHYDSLMPVTPTHGHILDTDTRYAQLVQRAVKVLRCLVDIALEKHQIVYVLMAEGNHDLASSVWLREIFKLLYENEPRVIMIDSNTPYYALQHGRTMLGWHHGHKKGLTPDTGLLFAERNKEMFGTTDHRYIHFGDKHHWAGKEISGFYLEQHPTLAGMDAHAARSGYESKQRVEAIGYHKKYGQAYRVTITPAMLAAGL